MNERDVELAELRKENRELWLMLFYSIAALCVSGFLVIFLGV